MRADPREPRGSSAVPAAPYAHRDAQRAWPRGHTLDQLHQPIGGPIGAIEFVARGRPSTDVHRQRVDAIPQMLALAIGSAVHRASK
jgi:hypothetical protein